MKSVIVKMLSMFVFFVGFSVQAQETIISKNELPSAAQKFISDYFPNSPVDYIKKDKELFSTEYKVKFTDGLEMEFDTEGVWMEIDGNKKTIATGFIQSNIMTYVKDKFPNAQIVKIEKGRFDKREVKLSNGLELEFNANGEFKKIDD